MNNEAGISIRLDWRTGKYTQKNYSLDELNLIEGRISIQ